MQLKLLILDRLSSVRLTSGRGCMRHALHAHRFFVVNTYYVRSFFSSSFSKV